MSGNSVETAQHSLVGHRKISTLQGLPLSDLIYKQPLTVSDQSRSSSCHLNCGEALEAQHQRVHPNSLKRQLEWINANLLKEGKYEKVANSMRVKIDDEHTISSQIWEVLLVEST